MHIFSISKSFARVNQRINELFTLPERFRGTFIEKWANYWKNFIIDYKEVAAGVLKEGKNNPRKAAFYIIAGCGIYACVRRNPGEEAFHRQFRTAFNEMILVSPTLQNPVSSQYMRQLQRDLNQNRLRFLSLGLLTIMWEDLYDREDCTYPAICEYTTVSYWNFHKHIIDVGFWNKFWRLQWKLRNYDVNYL